MVCCAVGASGKSLNPAQQMISSAAVMLKTSDTLVLGADALKDNINIDLKEIVRLKHDPRNGMRIRDLDISWQTIIVWSGTTVL